MRMTWTELTMVHWRYPADEIQATLPNGLTVETFDGSAWVGLVPFLMRVDVPFLPTMASVLHFPETNVRTYVHDEADRPGVWFYSLEASSLPAVVTARAGYGVPYFWSTMTIDEERRPVGGCDRQVLRYHTARRRWPRPAGASSLVEVAVGDAMTTGGETEIDRFLTARWALFGRIGPLTTYGKMYHEPWPLHRAELLSCDDELVAAAGLSEPTGEPLVHYSPGVNVRCGWPTRAVTSAPGR